MTAYDKGAAVFAADIHAPSMDNEFMSQYLAPLDGPVGKHHSARMALYNEWWDGYYDEQEKSLRDQFPEMYKDF